MSYYQILAQRASLNERKYGLDYISILPGRGVQATIGPREEGQFATLAEAQTAVAEAQAVFGTMYEFIIVAPEYLASLNFSPLTDAPSYYSAASPQLLTHDHRQASRLTVDQVGPILEKMLIRHPDAGVQAWIVDNNHLWRVETTASYSSRGWRVTLGPLLEQQGIQLC